MRADQAGNSKFHSLGNLATGGHNAQAQNVASVLLAAERIQRRLFFQLGGGSKVHTRRDYVAASMLSIRAAGQCTPA